MQAEVSKANSVILLKDASAIDPREKLQGLQALAEVIKATSLLLIKDASAVGASGSDQSELCIFN